MGEVYDPVDHLPACEIRGVNGTLVSKHQTLWSDDETSILCEMWRNRESIAAIASTLNRSASACRSKAADLHLTKEKTRKALLGEEGPAYWLDERTFREECERANYRYCEAVEMAGGGTWGGITVPRNAIGTQR